MSSSTSELSAATGGQVRQRGALEVGVDLLDDGVGAVNLVDGDRVRDAFGGGGEEGVVPPQLEQAVLPGALLLLGVGVGDAPHDQPACHLRLLLRRERRVGHLGNLRLRDPHPGVFVEDGPRVLDRGPGVLGDAADRGLDAGIEADGDRDLRAGLDRSTDHGMPVVRRIRSKKYPTRGACTLLLAQRAHRLQRVADQPLGAAGRVR